jgi:hypothetical protein
MLIGFGMEFADLEEQHTAKKELCVKIGRG